MMGLGLVTGHVYPRTVGIHLLSNHLISSIFSSCWRSYVTVASIAATHF